MKNEIVLFTDEQATLSEHINNIFRLVNWMKLERTVDIQTKMLACTLDVEETDILKCS